MKIHVRGYSIGGKGVSNAICEVCRGKFKNYELQKRWDGLMVCEEDWEQRHILDFYRPPKDNFPLPFIRKEDADYVGQVKAVLSADITTPTLGSWTLLPFNSEVADTLNEFNTGTSTFQPTTSNTYNIAVSATYNLSSYGRGAIAIYLNGSPYAVSDFVDTINSSVRTVGLYRRMTLLNTDLVTCRYYITGSASEIDNANETTFINVRIET